MSSAPSTLIVPIVEGHGEVQAVPVLIRRIFAAFQPEIHPQINPPSRIKAGSFLADPAYFEKFIRLAAAKAAQGNGTVLILLDREDDCPRTLGPDLLARARHVRPDIPCIVALAYREYETWFLAAATSRVATTRSSTNPPSPPASTSLRREPAPRSAAWS